MAIVNVIPSEGRLQAKTGIVPSTSSQTITADSGYNGLSSVQVNGDADLTAANIKKGVEVFGVTGTFTTTPSGKTALTAAALRSGYAGFINGSQVNGSMANTSVTEGTTTVSGETATRGTWAQTAGYTAARTISAATFANEGSSGTTYVDISGTTASPVLVSGDYLYINKGYTDNLKISLAKLVPDGSDVKGHGEYILSGHSAYDDDGTLVAGTIPTKASTDLSVSGKTVTVPSGYYASEVSADVATGTATTPATSITANPTISVNASGLITATASATKSVTPTVSAGYVSTGTAGTITVSGSNTSQLTTKAATTYNTSTSDQTIAKNTYLTGVQTIKAVTTSNIDAANIKHNVTVKVGDANNATRIKNVTGAFTKASTVSSGQTAATADNILSGYSAWVDGAEVQGNISSKSSSDLAVDGKTVTASAGYYPEEVSASVALGTVTSGTATISSLTYTYNSTNGNFGISGSANVSAPTVGTAGYVSSSEGTKNAKSGGATVSTTVAKIVGSTTITGTTTKTPSITKQATPSGVTNAASGNATTTAPTSGVYVAVKSAANTGTLTATPSVTTAGYGTADYHGIAANTATVGANASSTTYVPITTATPAFDGGILSGGSTATGTNVTLSSTDNGMKIQTAYTAASEDVLYNGAVAGWVSKADNAVALSGQSKASTNGTAYYVTAVTMPKDKGFTVTTTADTALDTTSDLDVTNNAYRRVDIVNKANGTVIVGNSGNTTVTSGSATAGNLTVSAYNSSGTAENNKSIVSAGKWVATSVSASGTYYGRVTVAGGAYAGSVSLHSITTTPVVTGSISGTVTNIGTTTTPSGTDGTNYWTITPSGSVTTTGVSTAKGKATISTAGYIAAGNNESSASTVNITPTVSNGSARYIVKGTVTNNTSGGTSTATINRGKQIKIGAGYYPSDLYYTAQNNSGTLPISASGTTSCNGYANVSVAAGSITNNTSGGTSAGTINRGSQIKIGAGYYASDVYYTAQNVANANGVSF